MITLSYLDETSRKIVMEVKDWDSAYSALQCLTQSPADIDSVHYEDGSSIGGINLQTFEKY